MLEESIKQGQTQSDRRFEQVNSALEHVVQSNHIRFEQQHILGIVRSQACMLGIQEMASKLRINIPSSEELMTRAIESTKNSSNLPAVTSNNLSSNLQMTLTPLQQEMQIPTMSQTMTQISSITHSQSTNVPSTSNQSPASSQECYTNTSVTEDDGKLTQDEYTRKSAEKMKAAIDDTRTQVTQETELNSVTWSSVDPETRKDEDGQSGAMPSLSTEFPKGDDQF